MSDTLFTLYLIVAIVGFVYSLREEARTSERTLAQCSAGEGITRLATALFLAVVAYPLAFFVAGGLLGVAGGLIYLGVRSLLTVLGLV
jgi:hypothetical protein